MFNVYLPIIQKQSYTPELGAHVVNPNADKMQYAVDGQSIAWVIETDHIEILDETGTSFLDWDYYDAQYEHIKHYPMWLQVKYVPEWMRSIPEKRCSPPFVQYWDHFADMVVKIVERYQPFAVEIWNEPEVLPEETDDFWSNIFGCWPNGVEFGLFLSAIYPRIKEAHPNVTFMGGALMLESDRHFTFAEEMCMWGEFDVLSFHAYPGFGQKNYDEPLRKAEKLMQFTDSRFWLSETSYRTRTWTETHEQEKKEYLEYVWKYSLGYRIDMIMLYTLANNNWEYTDLVQKGIKQLAWYLFRDLLNP